MELIFQLGERGNTYQFRPLQWEKNKAEQTGKGSGFGGEECNF